ncbi:hypothetical protein OUZ56_010132 [Daphnia magna]|uniref:Uncharacterized protein n=1 Tax=Daphnia magna TaxID=35525 RepID=A0ABR0AHX5_9CRUS|nr:hypothetical protein OUZ56_010132 [Daphnia magna]
MDELATFQEFCETAQHTILKPGLTRWLTLQPCAARVLEQYSPLLILFTSLVNEKPNVKQQTFTELQNYVYHLILDLSRSFMDGAYVNSLKLSPLTIDPRKSDRFLPLRSIHVGGLKASQAIADCQQPRTMSDSAQKQYFIEYFLKEKEEAERKAKKFAVNYCATFTQKQLLS